MSSENESVSPPLNIEKCSLILVDVAGTTTSIDFIKGTLLPFVVERAGAFLDAKWGEDPVKECVKQMRDGDQELDAAAAAELVKELTAQDSPNRGLKTLQGLIYREGYEKGDLKAHVFADVPEAFESWAKSRQVAVYSTGSVDSQKLLFAHTVAGDLSEHISKYFDQTIGDKTDAESYKKIAEEAQVSPEEIVFVTDCVKEATAAKAGGIHAVLIKRDGNPAIPEDTSKEFVIVGSFSELTLDKTSKRKNEEINTEAPPSKVPKTDAETEKIDDNAKQTEKIESESMEVDSQAEKPVDDAIEETKTATEETENLVKNTSEKTETKKVKDKVEEEEVTDADMKEVQKEDTEPQDTSKTTVEKSDAVVEEDTQVAKEPKPAEESEAKLEKPTNTEEKQEQVVVEKPKAEDQATKESKSEVQITVEEVEVTTDVTETVEENVQSVKEPEKTQPEVTDNKKVETAQPVTEELAKEDKSAAEEKANVVPEDSAMTEVKTEEEQKEEKVTESVENGEAETSTPKAEEKENKSVLANGVENGNKTETSEVDNTNEEKETETAEVTNDDNFDNKDDDNEVKVKKLEESAESKTVSVEV